MSLLKNKKTFNLLDDILSKGLKIKTPKGTYHIIGTEGDWNVYQYDLNPGESRKTESDKMTTFTVLLLEDTGYSYSVDWKTTYRNTKGVYFKRDKQIIYIHYLK